MLNLTRRNALLTAAVAGAAFGLPKPVSLIEAALAQKGPEAGKGFRPFKFGTNQGFILNDGVWEKPHDRAFIQNVSVEETKAALAAAGIANEVVPIPFNITLLNLEGDKAKRSVVEDHDFDRKLHLTKCDQVTTDFSTRYRSLFHSTLVSPLPYVGVRKRGYRPTAIAIQVRAVRPWPQQDIPESC